MDAPPHVRIAFRASMKNASNVLRVGFAGCGGFIAALSTATSDASCVDRLRVTAPAAIQAAFRARLARGRLARVPESNCRDAELRLTSLPSGYRISFAHGATGMTREVKSTELAAVWVESWLFPAESLDATPASTEGLEAVASGAEAEPPSPRKGTASAGASLNLPLSYAIGSIWIGPDLRYHQGIGRGFWLSPRLGLAYPMTHPPQESARMVRVSTTLEYDAVRSDRFSLTPGLDVGATTLLYRNDDTGRFLAGPTLGAQLTASVALSRSWWIACRLETSVLIADRLDVTHDRVYFSRRSDNPDPVDLVTTEERLEPNFIGAWTLGIVWRLGEGT